MKRIFVFLSILLVVHSCDKNQKSTNRLEGRWNITKAETWETGELTDYVELGGSGTVTFKSCDLEDDEYCEVSDYFVYPDGDIYELDYFYRVINDGANIEYYNPLNTVYPIYTVEIVEFKRKKLVLKGLSEGLEAEMILEKE